MLAYAFIFVYMIVHIYEYATFHVKEYKRYSTFQVRTFMNRMYAGACVTDYWLLIVAIEFLFSLQALPCKGKKQLNLQETYDSY